MATYRVHAMGFMLSGLLKWPDPLVAGGRCGTEVLAVRPAPLCRGIPPSVTYHNRLVTLRNIDLGLTPRHRAPGGRRAVCDLVRPGVADRPGLTSHDLVAVHLSERVGEELQPGAVGVAEVDGGVALHVVLDSGGVE